MADGANSKVCVDCENTIPDIHKTLKEAIERKLEEKDWSREEQDEFRRQFRKIYEETVELSLRENVIVQKDKSSDSLPPKEMEPVNKERAIEVNKMCAKSDELLTNVIQKRKQYPKRVRECLQKQHKEELSNLCELEKKTLENLDIVLGEEKVDMAESEDYLERFRTASGSMPLLRKTLRENTEKAKRLRTVTELESQMKDSDIHQTLFSKKTTFDSILATPTKESADDTENETKPDSTTSKLVASLSTQLRCKRKNVS